MGKSKWTPRPTARLLELLRRREAGEPVRALAEELGVTTQRVYQMLTIARAARTAPKSPEARQCVQG